MDFFYAEKLERLRREGLLREVRDRDGGRQGPAISVNGKTLLSFSSNDYLGLASSGALTGAAARAAREYGAGAGAARLLAGGCALHGQLEEKAARLAGAGGALLFNSGYHANTGSIPALAGPECTIFSDELNHASIIDGCRLSRARTVIYRHADPAHLEELLASERPKSERALVVTESVFSMDGGLAPLDAVFRLAARHRADLYVDDAHAFGVLGGGRGSLAHFGLEKENARAAGADGAACGIVRMCTFSKALGSYGAFVAAGRGVIQWLKNTARTFIFSTALPPAVAGASLAALEILDSAHGRALIARLHENRRALLRGLWAAGFPGFSPAAGEDLLPCASGPGLSPVIPVFTRDVEGALSASRGLFEAGFYVPAIRPPTVKRPRLRLQVTAAHNSGDLEALLAALRAAQSKIPS